jgi:hypothetical protein
MSNPATQIKNLITSHMRRDLFGMPVYGQHELPMTTDDGSAAVCILIVSAPNRFDYGQIVIFHPMFGKWLSNGTPRGGWGKPVQAMTADQVRACIADGSTRADYLTKVYGGSISTAPIPAFDKYLENQ